MGEAIICAECKKAFPPTELIRYEDVYVCGGCKKVFFEKLREGVAVGRDREYAGFWMRFAAKMLDSVALGFAMTIVAVAVMVPIIVMSVSGKSEDTSVLSVIMVIIMYAVMIPAMLFYHVFFVGKYGATPGKMATGLIIINADGSKVSYGKAFGRFFAEMVSGMTLYIGYIIAGFDDEKRSLHDHICGTRVIKKK